MSGPFDPPEVRAPIIDEIAKLPHPERLRRWRPDVMLAGVAASGHFLRLIVPDQVNAMLDRFLAILPLAAAAQVAES